MMSIKIREFAPLPREISLEELDPRDPQNQDCGPGATAKALELLPTSEDANLAAANAGKTDRIQKAGRQERYAKGSWYRRKADLFLSRTEPDASPMRRKGADHSRLGYQSHCVVEGGKARIILGVLVAPFEVTEDKPVLDMLWRAAFRWRYGPAR
jgi:hypothetical protein